MDAKDENKYCFTAVGINVACCFLGSCIGVESAIGIIIMLLGFVIMFSVLFRVLYLKKKAREEEEQRRWEELALAQKKKKEDEERIKQRKIDERNKMISGEWSFPVSALAQKCFEINVLDVSTDYNRQKARAIAEKILQRCNVPETAQAQYLTDEKLTAYFSASAENINKMKTKTQEKIRKEEKKRETELTKYANYVGREKWIAMIRDELDPIRGKGDQFEKEGFNAIHLGNSYKERKLDWSVVGGIADGLAGPGAGVAAALSAQQENNASVQREQNMRQLGKAIAQVKFSEALEYKGKEKRLLEELKRAETSAISNEPDKAVLQKLQISSQVKITETGAFEISTSIRLRSPIDVFGDVPTKVDGTIKALMYQESTHVGTALLVLPKEGIPSNSTAPICVNGIALGNAAQDKPYKIYFKPHHLWIMEA